MNIAVIPARGGSTRIPRKNIMPFHGKPIIAYSIKAALKSCLFKAIIVSTDDEEIGEIAVEHGATDLHLRSPEYARNEVGTQAVVANVLDAYDGLYPSDHTCCVYPTAPLMWASDLRKGLRLLESDPEIKFVFPVGLFPIRDAGAWYWGRTEAFTERYPLVHPESYSDPLIQKLVLPEERVCDINTIQDWARAEMLYSEMLWRGAV